VGRRDQPSPARVPPPPVSPRRQRRRPDRQSGAGLRPTDPRRQDLAPVAPGGGVEQDEVAAGAHVHPLPAGAFGAERPFSLLGGRDLDPFRPPEQAGDEERRRPAGDASVGDDAAPADRTEADEHRPAEAVTHHLVFRQQLQRVRPSAVAVPEPDDRLFRVDPAGAPGRVPSPGSPSDAATPSRSWTSQ